MLLVEKKTIASLESIDPVRTGFFLSADFFIAVFIDLYNPLVWMVLAESWSFCLLLRQLKHFFVLKLSFINNKYFSICPRCVCSRADVDRIDIDSDNSDKI